MEMFQTHLANLGDGAELMGSPPDCDTSIAMPYGALPAEVGDDGADDLIGRTALG